MFECLNVFLGWADKVAKIYDPAKVLQYNHWLYVCSGLWKYESTDRWKTKLYKYYQTFIVAFYGMSMTLFVIDAVLVRHDLNKLSFNMSSSVLVFMKAIEIAMLSRRRKAVDHMYDQLDNHLFIDTIGRSADDKRLLKKRAQSTFRVTVTFYGLLGIGLPLRVLADTAFDTKGYIIPIPFKDTLRPYYPYLYAQQVFGCFHFMATTLAFDLLQFTFLLRFLGHYDILEKNFLKIKAVHVAKCRKHMEGGVEGGVWGKHNGGRFGALKWMLEDQSGQERVFRMLKQSVKHHQKQIKNFCDIYSRPLLIQFCGMLMLIGILVLQLLFLSNDLQSPLFIQQIIYSFTVALNILYLSSFGSELTSKSLAVANALYDIPWHEMNTTNRRTINLILLRLMRGPKLKGGSIVDINRPMCLKLLQFSYNIVTLLRKRIDPLILKSTTRLTNAHYKDLRPDTFLRTHLPAFPATADVFRLHHPAGNAKPHPTADLPLYPATPASAPAVRTPSIMRWSSLGRVFLADGDLTRIYSLNYWTYVCTGFWELEASQQWKTYLYKAYHSAVVFVYLFSMYSYLSDAITVRYDLDKLSFNMSSNVLVLITFLKVTFLKMQSADVNKILANLENNLNMKRIGRSVRDKEILRKRAKVILYIHRVLYGLLVVTFMLRILADTTLETKAYLIPLPFNSNLDNHYEIIYVQQVVVGLHFLVTVMAHDLFIYGIINRFIAHFEILEENFLSLGRFYLGVDRDAEEFALGDVPPRNKTVEINIMRGRWEGGGEKMAERRAGQMLKENIRHHQELMKEILNFTRIYSSSFIIQASAAVLITGIVAIKILFLSSQITPLLIQQIVYIGLNLINNLFLCSLGSGLTTKSVAAADALYQIPWFEMGRENRRTVSIALKNLLTGAKLKGGGLMVINRRTYLKFLQISYNVIMLLRNLYRS